LSKSCYAFTAEGDPNTGVIVGGDGVMVIDAQATPRMAREVIRRVRRVTAKPIKYVVLTHYHAVRISRFPRLFRGAQTIPGLTWPTLTFRGALTLHMGKLEVRIIHAGAGHTGGDTIVWVPSQRVLFSGDLVEYEAGIYAGDAHLQLWPRALEKLRGLKPRALVPGRGPALTTPAACKPGHRVHPGLHPGALPNCPARGKAPQVAQGHIQDGTQADGPCLRQVPHLRALHAL
jgi:glyoxylase-like metal-dependent hydrolase (beta-lactamase superfamily II)